MKLLLLYLSFLSALVSDAHYTSSEAVYGDVFEEVRSMDAVPSFRSVNTCAMVFGVSMESYISTPACQTAPMTVANGTIRTIAVDVDNGTLAAVQPLYVMQYAAPQAQPVRRSPGVPSRAPIGDALCPLFLCAAIYVLHIRNRKHLS